jgi:uncharacterized protein (TIGR03067 family)
VIGVSRRARRFREAPRFSFAAGKEEPMKSRVLPLLALVLFAASAFAQNDAQKEQAKFQGMWVIESAQADGKEIPSDVFKSFKITFKGDAYTMQMGQEKIEGTFRLDSSANPKQIDILPENGPDRGRVQAGVYEVDGNKLRISAAQPGKGRPANFDTKDQPGQTLLVLRKQP